MPFGIRQRRKWLGAVISTVIVVAVSAVLLPFRAQVNPTEVALSLLLVVLVAATVFGSRAGLAASLAGMLCFNFFFLAPYYTFSISDPQNWVTFGAFIVTALIAGQLSGYASRRADEAEERKAEIERLYQETQAAFEKASETEALRRSEKLKTSLLDAVTHDLRTPLTSIKASVTTLLDVDTDAEIGREVRSELLEVINEEADRLNSIIENIVGVAKLEAGAIDIRHKRSSVDEIISIAVDRAMNQHRGRTISVRPPDGLPDIFADAASIAEALFTLLDNSVKYSADGSLIEIGAEFKAADDIHIMIQDQGSGIPPEMRESVFAKYYRGDEHTQSKGGLGLGLAFARGIIEAHGGSIWVEDGDDDFNTKFVVSLPIGSDTGRSK